MNTTDLARLIEVRDVLYEMLLESKSQGKKESHLSKAIRELTSTIDAFSKTEIDPDTDYLPKGRFDFLFPFHLSAPTGKTFITTI